MKKIILVILLLTVGTLQAQWFVPNPKSILRLNNLITGQNTFTNKNTFYDLYIGNTSHIPQILWAGDSQTASDNYSRYIAQKYYNGIAFADSNVAISGIQTKYYDSTAGAEIGSLLTNRSGMNILVIWIGVNDIASGTSAQATHSYIKALCDRHRNYGWRVIVATLPSVKTWEADRDTVNKLIYENWTTYADELADIGGNVYLGTDGQYANTTYFSSDSVHLSLTGYEIAGGIISDAIDRVLIGQLHAEIFNADSVHTRAIYGDTLYGKNLRLTGTLEVPNGSTSYPSISFSTSKNTGIYSGTGDMTFQVSGTPIIYYGIDTTKIGNNLVPWYTNNYRLGNATHKWLEFHSARADVDTMIADVYKQTSVIAIADSVINCNLSNTFSKTLGANQRFVLSNIGDGQTINIAVTNTTDNYTVLFVTPTGGLDIKWADGLTPTLTLGAKTDVFTFVRIGTVVYGNVIQNF